MKRLLSGVFTLLFILSITAVYGQQCGTTHETQALMLEHMTKNRENDLRNGTAGQRGGDTQYVPVRVHLVGLNDGSNYLNESSVLLMMCTLNSFYEDQDIVFYLKHPINYISNTILYNNPSVNPNDNPNWQVAQFHILNNKDLGAVNIYINGDAGPGSAGFYQGPWPTLDYIVIEKQYISDHSIAHEMGHFFSLAHPFFGWGQAGETGWDPNVHGWQVGPTAPQGGQNEKMDMSNCTTAADQICDTPPDYFFASSPLHDNDCTWDEDVMDPNGDVVVTMENNIMNYYRPQCDYQFTDDQKAAIWSSLMSNERSYIRHSYVPSTEPVTEAPVLVSPINGETSAGYNVVEFDWDHVPGATHYIFEVDFLPNFAGNNRRFIVDGSSSIEVEDFNPGVTYYWRVRPYSEGYTCSTPTSAAETFVAGDDIASAKNIDEVNDWAVIPNPVSTSEQLSIQLDASKAFEASINLYSVTGQQLKSIRNQLFSTGSNSYQMDIADLTPGIYVVTIQTDRGVANKKVVVTK